VGDDVAANNARPYHTRKTSLRVSIRRLALEAATRRRWREAAVAFSRQYPHMQGPTLIRFT